MSETRAGAKRSVAGFVILSLAILSGCVPEEDAKSACEAKCPAGSKLKGKECVVEDANVKCPEGSRFQSGACVATTRAAMVDIQRIIETSQYAKRRKDTLKADFDRKQKALDDSQAKLLEQKKAIETGKMSDAVKRTRIEKYERELTELQKTYVAFQNELKNKEQTTVAALIERVREVAGKVADRDGFEVVFVDRDVLWARAGANPEKLRGIPRDDLTDTVARELDKEQ
jgi:Skp family chaperone for outer membrane proteins